MVAVLYASGHTGAQLARMVPELTGRLLDYNILGAFQRMLALSKQQLPGVIRGRRLYRYMREATGGRGMSNLPLPVAVTATDLCSGREVLFTNRTVNMDPLEPQTEIIYQAEAAEAVLASMSIPGLFRPVKLGNRLLVDGGLMDNCPAAALKAIGATGLLAVNLVSAKPLFPPHWTFSSILSRSLNLGLHRMSRAETGYSDLVLSPDVAEMGLLDFSCISQCMEEGYDCARKQMDAIRKLAEGVRCND
jgi:NTE family protein